MIVYLVNLLVFVNPIEVSQIGECKPMSYESARELATGISSDVAKLGAQCTKDPQSARWDCVSPKGFLQILAIVKDKSECSGGFKLNLENGLRRSIGASPTL